MTVRTREWPLVAGLIAAAALVYASTLIHSPAQKSPALPAVPTASRQATATPASSAPAAAAAPSHTAARRAHAAASARPAHKATRAARAAATATATAAPAAVGTRHSARPTHSAPQPKPHAPARHDQPAKAPAGSKSTSGPPTAGGTFNVAGDSGQASAGPIDFTVSGPGHDAVAGTSWPLVVTARQNGAKVDGGQVKLDVVHAGQVVGHIDTGSFRDGRYRNAIKWPDQAIGYPLTVRVTIAADGHMVTFLYDVTVQKQP